MLITLQLFAAAAGAFEISETEWQTMKKELDEFRKNKDAAAAMAGPSAVDKALGKYYGPDAPAKTREGKLRIGGLLQNWYYGFQTDHRALFDDPNMNNVSDTNDGSDKSSFRIRRMQLTFAIDIHENVSAVLQIDPAKENSSFPLVTDNQVNTGTVYKTINNVGPEYQSLVGSTKPGGFGSTKTISNMESGAGTVPRMMEFGYINYHGVIPHHDFTIGQLEEYTGEESIRENGQLDFVERSFVGLTDAHYLLGAYAHGTWWDERFQYWLNVQDGAGNFFGSAGDGANRSDTSNKKDFGYRLLLQPVSKDKTWGDLEIGGGTLFGVHGTSNNPSPLSNPENGLVAVRTNAFDHSAWLYYAPGDVVSGLWLRGEWKLLRDRMAPGSVVDLAGNGTYAKSIYTQEDGKPVSTSGFYTAMGYKLSESAFRESCPNWLKKFEFLGRYQEFQNVLIADPIDPTHTDVYSTRVVTGGVNYYIKGHNAKIQANYNWVFNPEVDTPNVSFHKVRNDSFVVNFQVAF
ncbi:MAG: hypothetical protein ABSE73_07585 [Planctomycetota bacterium]